GIAGTLHGTPTVTLPDFSITGDVKVEFNRQRVAVHETIDGAPLDLDAGPFVRVAANHLTVSIAGTSVTGDFFFEHAALSNNRGRVTKSGVANLPFGTAITNARGALLILPNYNNSGTGMAGVVMGTIPGGALSVGLSINTLSGPNCTSSARPNPQCVDVDETV